MESGPLINRRRFMVGAAAAVLAGLTANQLRGCDSDITDGVPEIDNSFEPGSGQEILDPEVKIRPKGEDFGDADQVEGELSELHIVRHNAPIFTLIHTVKKGDTASGLATRYFTADADGLSGDAVIELGLKNIRAANNLGEDMMINEGQSLYIPISEPVAIRRDGMSLEEIAEAWGFSKEAVLALNDIEGSSPDASGWAYLPMQRIPETKDGEGLYVLENKEDGPTSYWGVAQELGTGLSTLLARNLVDPEHLEYGHILVVSEEYQDNNLTTTTTTAPNTTTTTTPGNTDPVNPGDEDGISPEDLIAQRTWDGEIVRTDENDKLEQEISVERMEEVVLTAEGYRLFVDSIDTTTFGSVFEEAGTTYHRDGKEFVIDEPEFFVIHHTAQGVEPGIAGMERLTKSILGNGLSVQWAINQDNHAYRLVTDPKIACNHAYNHNAISTGVELVTDNTRAQGSVSNEQLASAMYLAYYVVTEFYGREITEDNISDLIVGHREINDRTGKGKAGKPDFFEGAMDEFRTHVLKLADELN